MLGGTTLTASVPVPTPAINDEVACMILNDLDLEIDICLTGLRGAAHLNGREGKIRGPDPANNERWKVRLDDGTCVSVKLQISCLSAVEKRRADRCDLHCLKRVSPLLFVLCIISTYTSQSSACAVTQCNFWVQG